jgi:beta-galactosidase
VPWNFHEASPGAYDFSTPWRDLSRFLSLAQQKDLYVIMRAGPYMCGEWEYGGFPAWLLSNGTLTLRTYAEPYVTHATRYWRKLLGSIIKPLLFENGGPIIMTQVENEYGSYGDVSSSASDKRYIEHLVQTARDALGPNALLFTTDGGNAGYMRRGSLPGDAVLTVGDGCSDPAATWAAQKQFNPPGRSPFICAELYPGWLTHWGDQKMANTSSAAAAANLDASLSAANGTGSASLCAAHEGCRSLTHCSQRRPCSRTHAHTHGHARPTAPAALTQLWPCSRRYMAHGGTSFGWWAGANGGGGSSYQPDSKHRKARLEACCC